MASDRTYQYVSQYDTSFAADIDGQPAALPDLEPKPPTIYENAKNEIIHHNDTGGGNYSTFTSNDPKWQRVMGFVRKNP